MCWDIPLRDIEDGENKWGDTEVWTGWVSKVEVNDGVKYRCSAAGVGVGM